MQATERKDLGAFYTDAQVADFLVWWAVRSASDVVLDPCFGGGVFLDSACRRLVIVGNPPFIRYQRFNGSGRARAGFRVREQGIRLSNLSSSWAPFLIHSISLLKDGGRLAMVVPAEIGHASYSAPVVDFLFRSFGLVTILTFRKRLFPRLSQDTVLLLAEKKGDSTGTVLWRDFDNGGLLQQAIQNGRLPIEDTQRLDRCALASGHLRLVRKFTPPSALILYNDLKASGKTMRLGDVADVGIGYVTGSNSFFHPNHETVLKYRIPESFLRPAIRRGRDLVGVRCTAGDWLARKARGDGVYLLSIPPDVPFPEGVTEYVRLGEHLGVNRAYKCRVRSPWYSVPHVSCPDAFLYLT